jgi:asparagine synthase (glutamine-hydrolysing)
MCGLAGLLRLRSRPRNSEPPECDRQRLQRMLQALRHRGPDAEGLSRDAQIELGHRRLSIIDLSEAGRQPLLAREGRLQVVCNGEIFNHEDLRRELSAQGHSFSSGSDSEVLLHLYEALDSKSPESAPIQFVSRLRGMFAFALWDRDRGRLILGRDRLGQKPLYYRQSGEDLIFASEAGAIHQGASGELRVDWTAIHEYLALGAISAPACAIAGSRKLPPAHVLIADVDREPRLERYWSPRYAPQHEAKSREARRELDEALLARLDEAVKIRLMSDVPLGLFLSGGIDSSAVAISAQKVGAQGLRSFSIGFVEKTFDERESAAHVAALCGGRHKAELFHPPDADKLVRVMRQFGEPFADSSALPCWDLAALARSELTVALSGDGADEVYAGYMRHVADDLAALLDRVPRWLSRGLLPNLVRALPVRSGRDDPLFRLKRFMIAFAAGEPRQRSNEWSLFIARNALSGLLSPELKAQLGEHSPIAPRLRAWDEAESLGARSTLTKALHCDLTTYLPDDLLVKVDITSMAHGLEVRSPFLDHELLGWSLRLPESQKTSWGKTKVALKRALQSRLPRAILRAPKRGFAIPLGDWLRGPWRGLVEELLLAPDRLSASLFDDAVLRRIVAEHMAKKWNWHQALFSLMALELWLRQSKAELPAFSPGL